MTKHIFSSVQTEENEIISYGGNKVDTGFLGGYEGLETPKNTHQIVGFLKPWWIWVNG